MLVRFQPGPPGKYPQPSSSQIVKRFYNSRMPILNCKICCEKIYVKPSHLKLGYGKFCSKKCQNESQKKSVSFNCHVCENPIGRTPKQIRNSISHRFFCSKSCQTIWRNKYYSGTNHPGWRTGIRIYRKMMLESGIIQKCCECGLLDKRVLVVHHVDENRKNNSIENLVWLCRNCHYLIHNAKTI